MNRNSIKKSKTWVIKIGSSILADALSGVNLRVFRSLSEQVMQLRKKGHSVILVSSGAIACGMHQLGFVKKPKEIEKKQAIAAVGQITLMNHYARAFSKHGLTIAQILLTRSDIEDRKRYLNARHAIRELLKQNIIPIINENDTVAVEEIKFGDNDNLSALVAKLVEADLLVILSDIEGVYTANPQTNPQAVLIPLILKLDQKIESMAQDTNRPGSTGGMLTKIQAAKKATQSKIPTVIASGHLSKILTRLANGEDLGTLILPRSKR